MRGTHQGQQSARTASTGRTHDCKRHLHHALHDLLQGGGHPHMSRAAPGSSRWGDVTNCSIPLPKCRKDVIFRHNNAQTERRDQVTRSPSGGTAVH